MPTGPARGSCHLPANHRLPHVKTRTVKPARLRSQILRARWHLDYQRHERMRSPPSPPSTTGSGLARVPGLLPPCPSTSTSSQCKADNDERRGVATTRAISTQGDPAGPDKSQQKNAPGWGGSLHARSLAWDGSHPPRGGGGCYHSPRRHEALPGWMRGLAK